MTREQELETMLRRLLAAIPKELFDHLETIDSNTLHRGTREFPAMRKAARDAYALLEIS